MAKIRAPKKPRKKTEPARFDGGKVMKFPTGVVMRDHGDVIRSPTGRTPIPGKRCWGQKVGWNCVSTAYADAQGRKWLPVERELKKTDYLGNKWPTLVAHFNISGFDQRATFEYAELLGYRTERFKGPLMDAVNKYERGVVFTQYDTGKYRNFSHAIGMQEAKLILAPGENRPGNTSAIIMPDGSRARSERRVDFVAFPQKSRSSVFYSIQPKKKAAKKGKKK